MSEARRRWLDEGVTVLSEEGATGVRIDRIAARLGLSKGSFHHHFDGADGFRKDLLAHIEQRLTDALHEAVSGAEREPSTRDTLTRLTCLVGDHGDLYQPRLETALRAWALCDPAAAQTQATIDHARLQALQAIWRRISPDEEEARISALLPYVIAVGSAVIIPPLPADDLRRLFERILPLVPESATEPEQPGPF